MVKQIAPINRENIIYSIHVGFQLHFSIVENGKDTKRGCQLNPLNFASFLVSRLWLISIPRNKLDCGFPREKGSMLLSFCEFGELVRRMKVCSNTQPHGRVKNTKITYDFITNRLRQLYSDPNMYTTWLMVVGVYERWTRVQLVF